MALQDFKITDGAISQYGVVSAPDRLVGDPQENKRIFDRLIRESVRYMFNGLVDALLASTGAGEIGAKLDSVAGDSVQAILSSLKLMLDTKAPSADIEAALGLKADKSVTDTHVKDVEFDAVTGVFRFVKQSGSVVEFDTALEKVAVNWTYDAQTQSLVLALSDGSTQRVPLSDFITLTEFVSSESVEFTASGQKVTARIKPGSVTDAMLDSTLKEMLQGYVSAAAQSAQFASQHENAAREQAANALQLAGEASQYASHSVDAARQAAGSAAAAANSEAEAKASEEEARGSASDAQESARRAEDAELQARQHADSIGDKVEDAERFASIADERAQAAAKSAQNAENAKRDAEESAEEAAESLRITNAAAIAAGNSANAARESEEAAAKSEAEAKASEAAAKEAVGKTAYIGENGNWFVWDATAGAFVDSGVSTQPFPYVQPDEPVNAPENSLWVDTDEEAIYIARAEGVGF